MSLIAATSSAAEPGGPLDRLEPAPAGGRFVAVPDAAVLGEREVGLSVALSFARSPNVPLAPDEAAAAPAVGHQLAMHLLFSLSLAERFGIDIDLPATLDEGITRPGPEGASTPARLSESGVNDIRLGAQLQLLRQDGAIPAASLAFSVWTPSGKSSLFTGSGGLRYAPSLIVGGDSSLFAWSALIGRRFQGIDAGDAGGPGGEILFGAAGAAKFGPLRVGPEVFGATSADRRGAAFSAASTSLELLLNARVKVSESVAVNLAGGPGFLSGFGAPDYRVLAGFTFVAHIPSPSDEAGAGGAGGAEGSARKLGSGSAQRGQRGGVGAEAQGGAPQSAPKPPDQDGDGVIDANDACPRIIGSPTAKRPGCPPDRDADGITDADDRCPDEAGASSLDASRYGCPADADSDGIVDPKDACPSERGRATTDPKTNGCPSEVRLVGEQIVFTQQVLFNPGGAQIQAESTPLLHQMAQIIKDHPELSRVAIDGHTDNKGPERRNIALSQRRAVSVARWLIGNGIDARRLETRGFGPRRPIADNTTEEGRAKNRRVELQILRRSADGEAGWGALPEPSTNAPAPR